MNLKYVDSWCESQNNMNAGLGFSEEHNAWNTADIKMLYPLPLLSILSQKLFEVLSHSKAFYVTT